ncbi:MAG: peptidoglycan DD-metalloendopeptidase family protein [Sphaerobacter sp.]|nr:peptidoglycan DD-metalloendopeptidase family protein [Sphaerobacter sp.]
MPYWLLAALVAGLLSTSGFLIHTMTTRDFASDTVSAAVGSSPPPTAAELARLRAQLDALAADLARAQRDGSVLFSLTQEQSAQLVAAQTALETAEQRRVQEVQDLQARLTTLEQEIDTLERLAAEMAELVGMPVSNGPVGGPAAAPADPAADPAEAVRARIGDSLQRVESLHALLDEVGRRAQARLAAVQQSGAAAAGISPAALAFSPAVPRGLPVNGSITSPFGPRANPFEPSDGAAASELHTGIDLAVPEGTPVRATGAGVVRVAGWYGGYGNLVVIDHGNGISSYYGHNATLLVSVGQRVEPGQVIGLSGNTGRSTGAHVHYEIRVNNRPVDPTPYVQLAR